MTAKSCGSLESTDVMRIAPRAIKLGMGKGSLCKAQQATHLRWRSMSRRCVQCSCLGLALSRKLARRELPTHLCHRRGWWYCCGAFPGLPPLRWQLLEMLQHEDRDRNPQVSRELESGKTIFPIFNSRSLIGCHHFPASSSASSCLDIL